MKKILMLIISFVAISFIHPIIAEEKKETFDQQTKSDEDMKKEMGHDMKHHRMHHQMKEEKKDNAKKDDNKKEDEKN